MMRLLVLFATLLLVAGAGGAVAQAPGAAGSINGSVVDLESMKPIPGATVDLLEVDSAAGTRVLSRRTAVTDPEGVYRFDGVPPGYYRLQAQRLGYRLRAVEVDLRSASLARLSVALEVGPVLLPPLRVKARERQTYQARGGIAVDSVNARAAAARRRQDGFLDTDTRQLTHQDVVEAATLAETDLFRALQRAPGVSTRDDYTATMWTRGAAWDQTRVYFDGLPLFNPTHAGWLFSAVNPDAVGEVVFHPGSRPAQWGEGVAGVLDLRSREGGQDGGVRGRGELSLASARVALDGKARGEALRWMVAGRRTYVDLISGLAESVSADDLYIPYDFADLVGRVNGDLGRGWSYRASGIYEFDRLRGDLPGLLRGNRGRWGNRSGQLALTAPVGPVEAMVRTGETRFRAAVLKETGRRRDPRHTEPTLPPLESLIRHRAVTVEVRPRGASEMASPWSLGYQSVADSVGYEGPFSLLGELAVVLPRDTTPLNVLELGSRLRYDAAWAERRVEIGRVGVHAGVRAEWGDSVLNGGALRLAPRLTGRVRLGSETTVSAGWSRAWQYTQDIAPVAGPLGPQLHLTHLWILAQRVGYAAIRADIATLGAERWIAPGVLAGATLYSRYASGIEVPNPDSGRVVPDRDPSVSAANAAKGVELSVSKLSGRWTGSLGYSYGRSRMRAEVADVDTVEFEFPSSADIRHALDATVQGRLSGGLLMGAALTYGSGVPYTRLILPATEDGSVRLGLANEMRTPSYASVDLSAEYTATVGSWELTAYAQLRNLFDRDNAVTYAGSATCGSGQLRAATGGAEPGCRNGAVDRFQSGIPRLPLIGVRFTF